jgi:hypothetical protein
MGSGNNTCKVSSTAILLLECRISCPARREQCASLLHQGGCSLRTMDTTMGSEYNRTKRTNNFGNYVKHFP